MRCEDVNEQTFSADPAVYCRRRKSENQTAIGMKNRLRVLPAERDWTQEELANELGVTRQAIISIEKEKYDPSGE
jgi:ribosome-binding protein aMBF1 (putative translation factor)